MIVYNTTDEPIFITAGPITADPRGGRGHGKADYLIAPGEGIELDLVGLREKPRVQGDGICWICRRGVRGKSILCHACSNSPNNTKTE